MQDRKNVHEEIQLNRYLELSERLEAMELTKTQRSNMRERR